MSVIEVSLRRQLILRGPNLLAAQPLIRLELGAAASPGAWDIPASVRSQLDALHPELASDGPIATLADLVARLALALQREFGDAPRLSIPARPGAAARVTVAHEYRDPVLGLLAGRAAVTLLNAALAQREQETRGGSLSELRSELLARMRGRALPVLTRRIVWEAERRGIPWARLHPNAPYIQLGQGRKARRFLGGYSDATGYLPTMLATSKQTAADVLRAHGLPVPRQALAADAEEAVAAAQRIGYPVVVKPERADRGYGVSIDLADESAVRAGFAEANRFGAVLVEAQIAGDDHRITVIRGRMVAAGRDVAARVTGDGQATVRELIDQLNRDPRRGDRDYSPLKRVHPDEAIRRTLDAQGLGMDDVPERGRLVKLRTWWRPASDHTAEDVTDRVHPSNRTMFERAARLIGLDVAGVDFITSDISRPWHEVGGVINEINPTPGLNTHVRAGAPDILRLLLEAFIAPGDDGRIPTALVIDGPGHQVAARVALRAAALLAAQGSAVGTASTGGVVLGGVDVVRGDRTGIGGARIVLDDPSTEAAVLQVSSATIRAEGLPVDRAEVAAVVSIGPGASGRGASAAAGGTNVLGAQALALKHATVLAVLNAEDPYVDALATHCGASRLCLIGRDPEHPRLAAHVRAGGVAVTPTRGRPGSVAAGAREISLWQGTQETRLNAAVCAAFDPLADTGSSPTPSEDDATVEALFAIAVAFGLGFVLPRPPTH